MFRVSVRPHLHYVILRLVLTVFPVAQYDWASPYCQRPIRIHIIGRTGATKAGHPFLHYPWYDEDSSGGIAWGVLATPNLQSLLGVLKRQHGEDPILYPRYLIGATGQGASALRWRLSNPLPLLELIFLYRDHDIRVWLLAKPGKDPLDLLVLELPQDQGEGRDETPAPASGGHPFFDRRLETGWASGMTSEPGTTMTTTRLSTTAAAAKTKTMSITVTTTMIGCRPDRFTLLIAEVETLFKVTK